MAPLKWLERRLGSYAIPNLTLWLVAAQGFVYIANRGGPVGGVGGLADRLALVPDLVMQGQVWRLLTFPLVPPQYNPFVLLIYLSAFYYFGGAVEAAWGAFRYNAYLLLGFLFTAAASFAEPQWAADASKVKWSVFLAFATLYPDYKIMLYFVLPLKAKFLAAFTWALYIYSLWFGGVATKLIVLAAVANYFLFFGASAWRGVKQAKRRRDFKRRVESPTATIRHECRICGLTNAMDPKAAFRYCSQCEGQCCYCPDHLKDHEHVVSSGQSSTGSQR